jgi:transcriptional regulator with XRE-family HTH domain
MIEITMQPNGSMIKSLRRAKRWTQEYLAAEAGRSKRTIENAEAGKRIKESCLEDIAEALGVPVADLVVSDSPFTTRHFSNVEFFHLTY